MNFFPSVHVSGFCSVDRFCLLQDFEKRSPLHSAAYCGEAEIADLLIMNGARVNTKDNKWLTPLHRACCSKSEVKYFIDFDYMSCIKRKKLEISDFRSKQILLSV